MILSDIDNEVKRIVDECYKLTKQLVIKNRKSLDLIAQKLIEHETLSGDDINELLSTIASHDIVTPIPK
jgi:cell division protease FtsH